MEQMMKKPRRKFDAGVKAKIALEALRTTQERCPHAHSRNNKCKQQSQPDFEARSSRPLHLNSTGPWSRAWGPLHRYWKLDYPVIHPATSRGEKSFKASTSAWMNSSRRFISSTCSGEHSSNIS